MLPASNLQETSMAMSRDNLQCRIPKSAKESLARLCRLTERSQAKFIEIIIRIEEQNWLSRMTDDERKRYLAGQLSLADVCPDYAAGMPIHSTAELSAA
jgi:hypothetical protein